MSKFKFKIFTTNETIYIIAKNFDDARMILRGLGIYSLDYEYLWE